jgi:hypothetical protein
MKQYWTCPYPKCTHKNEVTSHLVPVLFQAAKKMHESQRLETDRAINELLGAINYISARIIYLRSK